MTNNEAIIVLIHERECVTRASTEGCDRKCADCDLVLEDKDIINAYNAGIEALQRVKVGHWKRGDNMFVCSVCNTGYKEQPTVMGHPLYMFCPCCGAKMQR